MSSQISDHTSRAGRPSAQGCFSPGIGRRRRCRRSTRSRPPAEPHGVAGVEQMLRADREALRPALDRAERGLRPVERPDALPHLAAPGEEGEGVEFRVHLVDAVHASARPSGFPSRARRTWAVDSAISPATGGLRSVDSRNSRRAVRWAVLLPHPPAIEGADHFNRNPAMGSGPSRVASDPARAAFPGVLRHETSGQRGPSSWGLPRPGPSCRPTRFPPPRPTARMRKTPRITAGKAHANLGRPPRPDPTLVPARRPQRPVGNGVSRAQVRRDGELVGLSLDFPAG